MLMIRSQDREKLYPLTHGLYVYGNTVMMDLGGVGADGSDELLGEYETESRCLGILDEIHLEFCEDDGNTVYQMPKE